MTRSRVLQIRMRTQDYEALKRIAVRKGVTVSSLARKYLLDWVESESAMAVSSSPEGAERLRRVD